AALHGSAGELSWGARELSPRWRRALRTADSSRRLARDARRDRTGHHPGECDRRPWAEETIVGQARRSLERPHRLREPSIVEMRKRHLEVAELVKTECDGQDCRRGHRPRAVDRELIEIPPEHP